MTDGIDSYKGNEIDWAVGTVIENAEGVGLENFSVQKKWFLQCMNLLLRISQKWASCSFRKSTS